MGKLKDLSMHVQVKIYFLVSSRYTKQLSFTTSACETFAVHIPEPKSSRTYADWELLLKTIHDFSVLNLQSRLWEQTVHQIVAEQHLSLSGSPQIQC